MAPSAARQKNGCDLKKTFAGAPRCYRSGAIIVGTTRYNGSRCADVPLTPEAVPPHLLEWLEQLKNSNKSRWLPQKNAQTEACARQIEYFSDAMNPRLFCMTLPRDCSPSHSARLCATR